MAIKARGELIELTDSVNLTIQFKDNFGVPRDTDSVPQISLISPSGMVILNPTSLGVTRIDIGKYQYTFAVPISGPYGVYNDVWVGYIDGFRVESTFSFVVSHTDLPAINSDGYWHLGDDVGFHYSQNAILNINKLLKTLRARLNSSGKTKSKDVSGNTIFIDCDIYSVDVLVTFLAAGLANFNAIPYFTRFTFEDTDIIDTFHEILVQHATIYALASKALIERGKEFQINDNGVSFTPPTMSELLNTQFNTLLTAHNEQVKYIKNSMRPAALGLGTLRPLAASPAALRLRHLRARQIF